VTRKAARFGVAIVLVSLVVADASAQDINEPPFPSVFGGGTRNEPHSFDTAVSVFAGYEDNDYLATGSVVDASGTYASVVGTLGYLWRGKRVQIGVNAGTENRYYRDSSQFVGVNQYGGFGLTATLPRRTTVSFNQTVSYSPAYFSGLFPVMTSSTPGDVEVRGGDYATSALNAFGFETSGGFSRGMSRTGTVEFSASLRQTAFDTPSGYDDLRSYSVGGRYLQRISRNATLRLGYYYRQGQYAYAGVSPDIGLHDIVVGIDYGRALSLFRRTHFEFGFGPTILMQPTTHIDSRFQYRVVGNASLNHEIGRTWRARVIYSRGLGFVDGLPGPLFSDGVSISVSGFANRRIEVFTSGGYTNGDVATLTQGDVSTLIQDVSLPGQDNAMKGYTGNARLQIGLTRTWAASVDYLYYSYTTGSGVVLPFGVRSRLDRSSVRAGFTLRLPW
jgi:hypothetical protein